MTKQDAMKMTFYTTVVEEEKRDHYYHVRVALHEEMISAIFEDFDNQVCCNCMYYDTSEGLVYCNERNVELPEWFDENYMSCKGFKVKQV